MAATRFILAVVLASIALIAPGCVIKDTTIILVRHAERGAGQDPPITPAGQQRAEALADVVRDAGVTAIYVSPARRTQQTAQPTATALGLTPIVTPLTTPEAHAAAIAADIRAKRTGSRVLVVGHTNTLPLILAELGMANPPSISETEFGRVFIAIQRKDASLKVIETRYGQ